MKAPFSPYLQSIAPALKALVAELGRDYDYVSVLSTDSAGFRISISQRAKSVSNQSMTTERGSVVRVYKNGRYSEYAFNEFDPADTAGKAAAIRAALDAQFELLGIYDGRLQSNTLRTMTEENENPDVLTVLLAHEPQYLDEYARCGVDLVLTGHAHGGQFRLPWIGGVVAPDQGFFPTYTEGIFTQDNTTMIISRGLGNSVIPVRLFNDPEIVTVTLHS